jgi:hypothetical protein
MEPEGSLSCSQDPSTDPYPEPYQLRSFIQRIRPGPRPFVTFRNKLIFYGEEELAPHSAPQLEDLPSSAVRDCLFNKFAGTVNIWRPFPPSAT